MGTILDRLAEHAMERVAEKKKKHPLEEIREKAFAACGAAAGTQEFPFEKALSGQGIHFICECKKASPSKGIIAPDPMRRRALLPFPFSLSQNGFAGRTAFCRKSRRLSVFPACARILPWIPT